MYFGTYFKPSDFLILCLGLTFTLVSFFLFKKGKYSTSILLLTVGAFFVRFFVAGLDHFLHTWDESLHALVAKNMMSNPFNPMLYVQDIFPNNDEQYIGAHIWLHKPPLFMWLMAISMKIFGVNEIAVRMPSVVLSALIVPMIYRIGKLTVNEGTGYYAAFLFTLSLYFLKIASGYINTDHNDAVFIFFVSATFWTWFEYNYSHNKKWIYVIGILSGMAVLVKWLVGLLVYFPWLLSILANKEKRKAIVYYKQMVISAVVSAIIFIPWQVYILLKYKKQALFAYSTFSQHFSQPLEGHSGVASYHVDLIGEQYGWIVPFVILIALYLLCKKLNSVTANIVLIAWLLTPYLVFALAKTKMPLMVVITCPVIFLSLGNLLNEIEYVLTSKLRKTFSNVIVWSAFILIGYNSLDLKNLELEHTEMPSDNKFVFQQNTFLGKAFKNIDKQLPGKNYFVFNCCCFLSPEFMFYTGTTAYNDIPDSVTIKELKSKGLKLAVLKGGTLPNYILNDRDIIKLDLGQGPTP